MAKVPLAGTELHPRRDRGAGDGAHRADARARTWRTRSTSCPSPRRSRDERLRTGRRGHRRGGPLRQALRLPGGRVAAGGRRPGGGDAGRRHQLAGGHHAPRGGRHAGRLRPLLQRVHQDLLPDPRGAGGRVARKVLIKHLQEGNSYGIQPQGGRTRSSRSRSSGRGSRARGASARTTSGPSWRDGRLRSTDELSPEGPRVRHEPRHRRGRARPLHRLAPRRGRRGRPRRRQDRHRRRRLRHRLRRRAQQLLPARDAGAHGRLRRGLGVRSRGASATTRPATSRSALPASRATSPRSTSARSASATPASCTWAPRPSSATCAACTPTGARRG